MNNANNECLNNIKKYIQLEYLNKKKLQLKDIHKWQCIQLKNIPLQLNSYDCGVFLCMNAKLIVLGNFSESSFSQVMFVIYIKN